MGDSTDEVLRVQASIHRRLSAAARLRLAFEMSAAARELAMARLRASHPDWDERDVVRGLIAMSMDGTLPTYVAPIQH